MLRGERTEAGVQRAVEEITILRFEVIGCVSPRRIREGIVQPNGKRGQQKLVFRASTVKKLRGLSGGRLADIDCVKWSPAADQLASE